MLYGQYVAYICFQNRVFFYLYARTENIGTFYAQRDLGATQADSEH